MIRPITVICWILALGAGLYLYRAKHEVELMDKHIEQIAKETGEIRAESRRLLDDWIRLGEPEQLHKYSDEYLGLKTIAPTQFARLSDLPERLPAPRGDPPAEEAPAVAQSNTPPTAPNQWTDLEAVNVTIEATDTADAEALPIPPIPPAAAPALASVTLPAVTPAVSVVPLQARPVTPRVATAQPEPKPRPVAEEPAGLAPKPTPVSFTQPRPTVPGAIVPAPANVQPAEQTSSRTHDLPPLQAQKSPMQREPVVREQALAEPLLKEPVRREPARVPGYGQPNVTSQSQPLPPLRSPQTQGLPPLQAQAALPAAGAGQAVGRAVPWPAETRAVDSRREIVQPRYADPRAYNPMPAQNGSLLGTSHGPVPLPLPAPTPVSATWPPAPSPQR